MPASSLRASWRSPRQSPRTLASAAKHHAAAWVRRAVRGGDGLTSDADESTDGIRDRIGEAASASPGAASGIDALHTGPRDSARALV